MKNKLNLPELIKQYRESILEIAYLYKAKDIKVFGSVARGDYDENSDIDFLVSFSDEAGLYDLIGLKQALQELFNCSVDIATPNSLKTRIKERVLKEAKAI
jgi:predicted nucleotidyltransferase